MDQRISQTFEAIYEEDILWEKQNDLVSRQAQQADKIAEALDYSLHQRLPDTCWITERWEESRHWYNHNARILLSRRAWHQAHSRTDYPLNELIDWEAITLTKSGQLKSARSYLKEAINYWQQQPNSSLILVELGLHAAQAGEAYLADAVSEIIAARRTLILGQGDTARQIAKWLNYETAQAALLLGQMDKFESCLSQFSEAERLIRKHKIHVFPDPLQTAISKAFQGFQQIQKLQNSSIKVDWNEIATIFEEAMLYFFRLSGSIDYNLYFMRLNTLLVKDIANGRPINPNPFSCET